MMRELGRLKRLPRVPAASSTAAIDAACPMQNVTTSGRTNFIVSRIGEAGGDRSARRVEVYRNIPFRILGLQKEQLGDHEVGDLVVDRCAQKDDVLLQQPRVDIVGAFAP